MKPARSLPRLLCGLTAATLLLGTAAGADAASKHKKAAAPARTVRTVTLSYTGGCTIELNAGGNSGAASPNQCTALGSAGWTLNTNKGEKFASVTVTDASGQNVPGQFWIKGTALGHDTEVPFCGKAANIPVPGQVLLDLDAVGAVASCPGAATSGKVTVVFSNLQG